MFFTKSMYGDDEAPGPDLHMGKGKGLYKGYEKERGRNGQEKGDRQDHLLQ
jgi:hypothetical protein